MKKIMVAMMAVLILTTGCSKKEESNQDTNVKTNESIGKKEVKGTLTFMDTDITPGKSFNEKSIASIPEKSELPSCALEGMDHVYKYEDLEITANVKDGKETIYSVYFITENVTTPEGVKIGDSKTKLLETYGSDFQDDVSLITYTSDNGKVKLNFQIENNTVSGIEYAQVLK
ncbi:MAG: hypothetical protein OSJ65_07545 [Bacilli bacterium]|nr:hypothetical protein [Bacilli bacterium]